MIDEKAPTLGELIYQFDCAVEARTKNTDLSKSYMFDKDHRNAKEALLEAYEAAKPSPPMSTSGEMVACSDAATTLATQIMALDWKARKDWSVEDQAWRHGELQEMIASRIEALVAEADAENTLTESLLADERRARFAAEALVAEQAGEIELEKGARETAEHGGDLLADEVAEWKARALSAEAALAKGGG